jgi:hypothetical protein
MVLRYGRGSISILVTPLCDSVYILPAMGIPIACNNGASSPDRRIEAAMERGIADHAWEVRKLML